MVKPFERERRRRASERRESYEFSGTTKQAVFQRAGGYCEHCKIRRGDEYHHVISIEHAIAWNYDPTIISSAENCKFVCSSCHKYLDHQ